MSWVSPAAYALRDGEAEPSNAGALRNLSFVVKDNIDIENVPTTAGFAPLHDAMPAGDARLVSRLREAGGILLGKANMSELAISNDRLGYSSTFGLTRNPHDTSRNAAGSSSGAAAAVAAGFASFAIGTDTSGSIRAPAAATGCVGFRPTHGSVPLDGIVPLSPSLDTAGPIAANVDTAARVFSVLRGDAALKTEDLSASLEVSGEKLLEQSAIVMMAGFDGLHPEIGAAISNISRELSAELDIVSQHYAALFEHSPWPRLEKLISAEFGSALSRYLSGLSRGPKNLRELEERLRSGNFPATNRLRVEQILSAIARTRETHDDEDVFRKFKAFRAQANTAIRHALDGHNASVLCFPTMLCPASPAYDQTGTPYECAAADPYLPGYLACAAGAPEIAIPIGSTRAGLPIGMSILGPAGSDDMVLRIASRLEALIGPRVEPPELE
ncbi:amidase [Aurantiacibacter sediminis]|uniref:amidase n=1 Tax=Aurantiacibacter sediminis TaxID=2793064 RepID=UPI002D7F4AA6|nr:amidase [Aurantiacibacter sediminis]